MDGGNNFRQAKFLGNVVLGNGNSSRIDIADTFEGRERAEWYRFRIQGRPSSVLKPILTFAGSEFASRMEVFQAAGNRPGKRLVRLDTVNNQVQRSLPTGTFFVKITGRAASASGGNASFAGLISLFS